MPPRPPHRIRRQRWSVGARSEEQAFALSRRLRADLDDVLLPALAAGFDEVARGDEVIHLSRLELRVRIARVEDVADKLPDLLAREAAAQVRALTDRWVAPPRELRARASQSEDRVRLLTRYFETGALPWQHTAAGNVDVRAELEAALPHWLEQAADTVRARVWSRAQLTAFVLRVLQVAAQRDWVVVAQALLADLPATTRARVVTALAVAADAETPLAPPERAAVWMTIARAIVATSSAMPPAELIAAVAATLQARSGALSRSDRLRIAAATIAAARLEGDAERVATVAPAPPQTETVMRTARRRAALLVRQWLTRVPRPTASPPSAKAPLSPTLAQRPGKPGVREAVRSPLLAPLLSRPVDYPPPAAPTNEFALLVSHGGLILLHPYLPQLFEQTGITGASQGQLDPAVLPRAAALLYLLATGRAEAHEFELGFIKVLLGVRLDEPLLVADGLLDTGDHAEVDALLNAVIGHWSVLRGTSADGLRSSFLQRPALLHEEADGWRLRVQSHAVDVVLDHLPWSIGIARLPWMAKAIYTEWQAR